MNDITESFNSWQPPARTNACLILLLMLTFSLPSLAEPGANPFRPQDAWVHIGYSMYRLNDDNYADEHLQMGNLDTSHGWNLGASQELNPAHRLGMLVQIDQPFSTQRDNADFQISSNSLQFFWQQNISLGGQFMLYVREGVGLARINQTLKKQEQSLSSSEKLWFPSLATGAETHFRANGYPMFLFLQASYSRYSLSGEQVQTHDFDLDLYALTLGVSWFL